MLLFGQSVQQLSRTFSLHGSGLGLGLASLDPVMDWVESIQGTPHPSD